MLKGKNIIAFCDLHISPVIPGLNDTRSLGTVAFLGRFAIMDFTLSNFSNSGFDRVGILVHRFPHSVLSHVENGQPWISNTKTGFQYIMYNEEGIAKPSFNTDVANIIANRAVLEREKCDIIVVAPIHYLCSMDYRPIVQEHIEKNAAVTAVYTRIKDGKRCFTKSRLLNINDKGLIKKVVKNTRRKDEVNVSLDTFIINKDTLDEIIQKHVQLSKSSSLRDLIAWLIDNEGLEVNTYMFNHPVFPILSLNDYVHNSFACLKYENRRKLFKEDWPIYTTSHDTPPSKYGENADASDSIISNGAVINGKVKHSILSRNVTIDEGAVVENSILFTYSHIHKGVKLNYVLTEKHVEVTEDISGTSEEPIVMDGKKTCKV
ncbi:MAG: glucose-1-phosphate adenylyltransferase subunit GlgD [Erysipelotrichaceae bacterium]|nr:glucose-1-phosphate adenylyltransferase subunit GlgD [Erysipelotrichaceae bacterium]